MALAKITAVVLSICLILENVASSPMSMALSKSWAASQISVKKVMKLKELDKASLAVSVEVSNGTLRIHRENEEIYRYKKSKDGGGGVHVLALHESTGHVLMARAFRTYHPADQLNLRACLSSLQPGRIVILAGMPDFLSYLAPLGLSALVQMGSKMLSKLAEGEPWAMISIAGEDLVNNDQRVAGKTSYTQRNKVIAEAVATRFHGVIARSLKMTAIILRSTEETRCKHVSKHMSDTQIQFCESYEGYGDLCHCENPFIPSQQPSPPGIPMHEEIPIVIVTANKPYHLYRLLKNLKFVWGSGETKVLVVSDGPNEENIRLCQIFEVEIIIHTPQGETGENTRTNMNIAFALYSVFSHWPEIDKAILLEDDLILAPDLLSYFHQTAPILTRDPTLYLVNAFGQNSYPSTADDPSSVLRVDMYPQYGWMTCRRWVEYVLPQWVPEGSGVDWDWWVYLEGVRRNLQAIVPEVSRTGHAGAAGAHVTGWEQHSYFNSRIMTNDPLTILRGVDRLVFKSYSRWFENEIRMATKVGLSSHPCHTSILPPQTTGPFVLYLGVASREDGYHSFYLLQACLGTDDNEVKELYEGVMRLNIRPYSPQHPKFRTISQYINKDGHLYTQKNTSIHASFSVGGEFERSKTPEGQVLYLVGCPLSKYCRYSNGTSDWVIPNESILKEADRVVSERKEAGLQKSNRVRVVSKIPEEDFAMNNTRNFYLTYNKRP